MAKYTLPQTRKAWVGALVAGLVAAAAIFFKAMDNGITSNEWLQVLGAFVAGTGILGPTVFKTRNAKVQPKP